MIFLVKKSDKNLIPTDCRNSIIERFLQTTDAARILFDNRNLCNDLVLLHYSLKNIDYYASSEKPR